MKVNLSAELKEKRKEKKLPHAHTIQKWGGERERLRRGLVKMRKKRENLDASIFPLCEEFWAQVLLEMNWFRDNMAVRVGQCQRRLLEITAKAWIGDKNALQYASLKWSVWESYRMFWRFSLFNWNSSAIRNLIQLTIVTIKPNWLVWTYQLSSAIRARKQVP